MKNEVLLDGVQCPVSFIAVGGCANPVYSDHATRKTAHRIWPGVRSGIPSAHMKALTFTYSVIVFDWYLLYQVHHHIFLEFYTESHASSSHAPADTEPSLEVEGC